MATAYLKIGDIRGESMDARFPGWIPIESFSQGGQSNIGSGAGPGEIFGPHVRFSELQVTKYSDLSTVKLQQAAAMGTQFDLVVLCIAGIDESKVGSAYMMENTLISS